MDHGTLDAYIEKLMQCKHLTEAEVQELCNKVCFIFCTS